MFKFETPVFVHKNILKKEMLDELRDYPIMLSRLIFQDYADGVLKGCAVTWEDNVLKVHPGLLLYDGNIYRMEEAYSLDCPPVDRRTFIKVRFMTMDYGKSHTGGLGDIYMDEEPPEDGEMELGRFRLQEGARLRTEYENFEDFQTEFDTVNRIHMPYACPGGSGLWPKLLLAYAYELLETGTDNVFDVSFAMQILGTQGQAAGELVVWYVEKNMGEKITDFSNGFLYGQLLHILRERRTGNGDWRRPQDNMRQMLLL